MTTSQANLERQIAIYREYFLAWDENAALCDRTGVTKEEHDANQKRLSAAERAVRDLEIEGDEKARINSEQDRTQDGAAENIGTCENCGNEESAVTISLCLPCADQLPDPADTITITIKRKVARDFLAEPTWGNADSIERASKSVRRSIRAALEGEK